MFFLKGLVFGLVLTGLNFYLIFVSIKNMRVKGFKVLYILLYIIKLGLTGLLIYLFIKYKWGNIIGLVTGVTAVIIIWNIGILNYVRTQRGN